MMEAEDSYENEKLKDAGDDIKIHRDQELDFSEKGIEINVICDREKENKT
jgi:hypothetical protein